MLSSFCYLCASLCSLFHGVWSIYKPSYHFPSPINLILIESHRKDEPKSGQPPGSVVHRRLCLVGCDGGGGSERERGGGVGHGELDREGGAELHPHVAVGIL